MGDWGITADRVMMHFAVSVAKTVLVLCNIK